MSIIIPNSNIISSGNSTTALLGVSATFTGTWESVVNFTSISVAILGTNATDGVLWFDVRKEGSTIVNSVPFFKTDITGNATNIPSIWNIVEGEFRIRYINGTTAQLTEWYLVTKYSNGQQSELLSTAGGTINTNTPVSTTKSVITSKQPSGTYKDNPHNGVAFTTSVNLGIGATYTSPWIDTDGYNSIELFINSDVVSANRGIDVEFTDSLTGLVIQEEHFFTFGQIDIDRGYLELEFPPRMVGFRVEYTNGAAAQTSFLLQTDLKINGDNQRYNSGGALIIGDFQTEMALGHVPNHTAAAKYGVVSALDAADPKTTVWSVGDDTGANVLSRKTFPTATGTLHMASTSASDTAKEVTIVYNDANNNIQTISANLNGQTPVSLAVTALDANTAYISGNDQTLVGDVFISLNSSYTAGVPTTIADTICFIKSTDGRSAQATLRVPANSKMAITNTYIAISRLNGSATSARVDLRVKPLGASWYVLRPYVTTSSLLIDTKEIIILDAGTVIEFCIDEVSDGDTNCVVIFDYEIVEE